MGVRRELKQAAAEQRLVRVVRRKGWSSVEGYVAAVGREWFVVVSVIDGLYDGHVLLRDKDVRALKKPHSDPALSQRFLELEGRWPPAAPHLLDLHDTRSVAFTAGSVTRTLSVSGEARRAGWFFVGDIHRITARHLMLLPLTADGQPAAKPRRLRLLDLTRLVLWDPRVEQLAQLRS